MNEHGCYMVATWLLQMFSYFFVYQLRNMKLICVKVKGAHIFKQSQQYLDQNSNLGPWLFSTLLSYLRYPSNFWHDTIYSHIGKIRSANLQFYKWKHIKHRNSITPMDNNYICRSLDFNQNIYNYYQIEVKWPLAVRFRGQRSVAYNQRHRFESWTEYFRSFGIISLTLTST